MAGSPQPHPIRGRGARVRPGRRALFAVVVLLGLLGAVELGARAVEPSLSPARTLPLPMPMAQDRAFEAKVAAAQLQLGPGLPLVADESLGWTLPPARTERYGEITMRYNQLGMRGPDWPPPADGEVRILTLGDSSIFGLGVMERYVFSSVAATDLEATWHHPVTAVIGGIPGYSTRQSRELLARVGASIHPGWIVIGNMWSDLLGDPAARVSQGGDEGPVLRTLRGYASYRLLRQGLTPWLAARKVRFLSGRADAETGTPRTDLGTYIDSLHALAADARALGAHPAFLALPAPMDLDRAPLPERVVGYRAAMAQVAADEGAPFVDGPALAAAEGATLGWWLDQVHPSAVGHRALGHALATKLAAAAPTGD